MTFKIDGLSKKQVKQITKLIRFEINNSGINSSVRELMCREILQKVRDLLNSETKTLRDYKKYGVVPLCILRTYMQRREAFRKKLGLGKPDYMKEFDEAIKTLVKSKKLFKGNLKRNCPERLRKKTVVELKRNGHCDWV